MLTIVNDGQKIRETNFWQLSTNKFWVSVNAGCMRLLVPRAMHYTIDDIKTGKEVVVSRGPMPSAGILDGMEIMFDDHTDEPFAIHVGTAAFDLVPNEEWIEREFPFHVYTETEVIHFSAHYRVVRRLPCLKRWVS